MADLLWLILALPALGFVVLALGGRRIGEPGAGWLATAMISGSFVLSAATFVELLSKTAEERRLTQTLFTWLPSGNFKVGLGLLADPLSVTMCLFVTGVGALIHLYSIGYMKGDKDFSKFFMYLNLFVLSMLTLVLGDNLLVTFLGWEGVGLCSYFLISFWFTEPANATAGKKAFVTNRVGDWGYMVGMFLMWTTVGSLNYVDISAQAATISGVTATALVLLFFVASTGKSAQIPLFVWLPDAMLGPTPVSALIHAATMVTSGVYLLVRLNPVLLQAGWANDVIAWVGGITALVAATTAIAQHDIKKVLAYSTISQLGFLFMAVGTGSYVAAIFHMVTHAFFKALLFLGSGSVILGMSHEQDMRRYGNLRKYLPITAGTMMVAWLAISGIPPFSGFWSKDEILSGIWTWHGGSAAARVLWALALIAALLTAFYMTRLIILTFFGDEKWRDPANLDDHAADHAADHADDHAADHAHHGLTTDHTPRESGWLMTVPLIVLGVLSLVGGLINLPWHSAENLTRWLHPVLAAEHEGPSGLEVAGLATIATIGALIGLALAFLVYVKRRVDAARVEPELFARAWYIDWAFTWFSGGPGRVAWDAINWFDHNVIDGAVNGVAALAQGTGRVVRKVQNGQVRSYALGIGLGAALVLGFVMVRMTW